MENSIVTWLIVIGLILLQFIGSNKKKKAAEDRKKAILEEQMRRAAETSEYSYELSSEDNIDYSDVQRESQPEETIRSGVTHSEDPFDFFNLSKIVEKVDVMMSANKSYFDIEDRLSGKSEYYAEPVPSVEAEAYKQNYHSDSIESDTIVGDYIVEGVRTTVDDAGEIGGINDEAGLYNEEYEARDKVSPVIASFDPKLFVLYSEIVRPKYQE